MTAPRVSPAVAVGALVGRLLALSPGMLPRSALIATVAGVVLTLIGMGVGGAAGWAITKVTNRKSAVVRPVWLAAGLILTGVALGFAVRHEVGVRSSVGAVPIGPWWVLIVGSAPITVAAAVIAIPPRVRAGTAMAGLVAVAALVPGASGEAKAANRPDRADLLYGQLTDPGSFRVRADRLVARWEIAGGMTQRAVVVAAPTGSGWLDASSVEGVSEYFGGSVATLALQYDNVASWRAFVSAPDRAGEATVALLASLWRTVLRAPASTRPQIYLMGQSLGAVGADSARRWAATANVEVAGTILTGPPAGTISDVAPCERRVIVANDDDPVPSFAPSLLWHRVPRADGNDRPWLPVMSLVGTVLDLAGSLNVPAGHGHRYGTEQGAALARMPAGCR